MQNPKTSRVLNLCAFTVIPILTIHPEFALAAGEPWDNAVNAITGIFTGGLARAIAILVVIGLGIAAFVGKLSWKMSGSVIGGIVLVFGATSIADFFIASV